MKKIITLFITVLLLLSLFSLTASATKTPDFAIETNAEYADLGTLDDITLSSDFKTLYCGENIYNSFPSETVRSDIYFEIKNGIFYSPEQENVLLDYNFSANKNGSIIEAHFEFKEGYSMDISYLNDKYREEYNKILSDGFENYSIDFSSSNENHVETDRDKLLGEKTTLENINDLLFNNYYEVFSFVSDRSFYVIKGQLLDYDGEYYYIDFNLNNIPDSDYFYAPQYDKPLLAYRITDLELLQQISDAEDIYFNEDFGFFFDEEFTEKMSAVFLIIVFGIIPLGVFILFLILSFKAKKVYKKLFTVIYSIAAAELTVFTTIALLIIK